MVFKSLTKIEALKLKPSNLATNNLRKEPNRFAEGLESSLFHDSLDLQLKLIALVSSGVDLHFTEACF